MTDEGASRTGVAAERGEGGEPTEPDASGGREVPGQRADDRGDEASTVGLSTAPLEEAEPEATAMPGSFGGARAPGVGGALRWTARELVGWGRWFWRQLTSMRVALLLLFLLALASVPGSLIPQERIDATAVQEFRANNPGLGDFYDRLQLFEVYSSIWFSAIYLLLFVSLIGCILPRSWQFVGQLRGRPPRAPRRLDRMPAYTTWRTDTPPQEVLDAARAQLRKKRFRTDLGDQPGHEGQVAAEKGYLREAGNLLFHVALIVMLMAFAMGQLYHSEGGKLVVEGSGFSNALPQYDDFSSGQLFDVDELERFGFTLDEFDYRYSRDSVDIGTPTDFRADVTYWTAEGVEEAGVITVNNPLKVGDSRVRLLGHGYAPVITVTDGQGNTAFSAPVPFLPQDAGFTSVGVIKVSDYVGPDGERSQLGFQGFFNPTYNIDDVRGPHSTFPEPDYPVLTLNAFEGDLGVSSGIPQNVYQLNTDNMEQLEDGEGDLFRFDLLPGDSIELPDGRGTLTFEHFENWATFSITTREGNSWALFGSLAAILGLTGSLFLQRRRVWVRARTGADGVTVVEMASLGRTESARIPEELGDLAVELQPKAPPAPDHEGDGDDGGDGGDEGAATPDDGPDGPDGDGQDSEPDDRQHDEPDEPEARDDEPDPASPEAAEGARP
ncbi:cytochrome c biogenesis protein ResB [Streptomyces profundus]|uniref:cytochrome c biogenesis protein ResB n=1 Tax=Streptomyces profundus TaxID=2867410 RepID=UPI001D161F74|nr:cytochrome c biogenesis protein ResB [Streptomyces sp. MA3_2.13]UED84922.1 cytochrome c biogenesis protein ResB [Streptomyces sp. MA3_2.13]